MKLTIGMSCYDDYDGVWFTIQSIKMFHPECIDDINFVVVDGNPGSRHGQACEQLVSKLTNRHGNNGLYVKNVSCPGTASRNYVFQYAKTPYVLCVDSHVMIEPGAIKRLLNYYDQNPECDDLLQGPLLDDNGKTFATRMDPVWEYNMLGRWVVDESQIDAPEPYEVELMGLGLFSARKESWLKFNERFRGFGGEEGYIHKKYRKHGRKTLILPWLKWNHRFERPNGVPYKNDYHDRIKNYMYGWAELGEDPQEIIDYYSKANTEPGQERAALGTTLLKDMYYQCAQQIENEAPDPAETHQENNRLRARVVELEMKLMEMMLAPPSDQTIVEVDPDNIDSILNTNSNSHETTDIEQNFADNLKQSPITDIESQPVPVEPPSN